MNRRAFLTVSGLMTIAASSSRSVEQVGAGNHVNVDAFGASYDESPSRNLEAFRTAITATPAGGTLLIPRYEGSSLGATYRIDTSGGLSEALVIDRPITIVLDGMIRATDGASGRNPPYIFAVTASDVHFTGGGTIAGPGQVDDSNNLDDAHHSGLIRVTGDRFQFIGPTVRDVPKIGIHLWKCSNATISALWTGGIARYTVGHTGLFGIRATGGGGHRITNNRFERDIQGRRLITGYFAGGLMGATTGDEITGNVADVHEKLAYLYTNHSRVANCHVINALRTDILRVVGSHNVVERLSADRTQGGVSIYNGTHNTVRDCIFQNVRQAGIFISFLGDYRGGYTGTTISGNLIVAAPDAVGLQDGICLYLGAGETGNISVTGNRIEGAGTASWKNAIRVEAIPPFFADRMTVSDNILHDSVNGLSLRRLHDARLDRNEAARLRGGEALLWITS